MVNRKYAAMIARVERAKAAVAREKARLGRDLTVEEAIRLVDKYGLV